MNDSLDLVFRKDLVQYVFIADISFVELGLRVDCIAMARLQVIDDDDIFPLLYQLMYGMRANITGTATNENRHVYASFLLYPDSSIDNTIISE